MSSELIAVEKKGIKKLGSIRIKTKKIFENGLRERKILGFEGVLKKGKLPDKYTEGEESFYYAKEGNMRHCLWSDNFLFHCNHCVLIEGEIYSEEGFHDRLVFVRKSGNKLHQINKEIRESNWKGEETFII